MRTYRMTGQTRKTRKTRRKRQSPLAIAVFKSNAVRGDIVCKPIRGGIEITAVFTKLPPGKHGFHIHSAGDLRGEGCAGACSHYHIGSPSRHGGPPDGHRSQHYRHTGDLGNIEIRTGSTTIRKKYVLANVGVEDLWGRSAIVHADEDDLGKGFHEDSQTTGHSGSRIGCAIFGRAYTYCI